MYKYIQLNRRFLEGETENAFNWTGLCRDYLMTEAFIDNFKTKVDWRWIAKYIDKGYYVFSKPFMAKFEYEISNAQRIIKENPGILYTPVIDLYKYKDNTDIKDIPRREKQPPIMPPGGMIMGFQLPPGYPPIIGVDSSNFGDNGHPAPDPYGKQSLEEETIKLKKTVITPENFEDVLGTPIYKMSRSMLNELCSDYKLSPEFVFKYEDILNFKLIMVNEYFPKMMSNDKFFDRYLERFRKLSIINHPVHGKMEGVRIRKDKLRD